MESILKAIVNYLFEIGGLRREQRSGWKRVLIKDPDSVAEHVARSSQIAYILAIMEKANPERAACICMFHDNAETRITDLHKIAQLYINKDKGEANAFNDQLEDLGDELQQNLASLFVEYQKAETEEAMIVHDADVLELAFSASEYLLIGYPLNGWLESAEKKLQTESAKQIFQMMKKTSPIDWSKVVFSKKEK